MARLARVVVPGYFHHITQWGNRSQNVFFSDRDKYSYLELLDSSARKAGIKIYAFCLMDNHVHLIAMPAREDSFSLGIAKIHREYTNMVNRREGWKGHLWQGRFMSYPFDYTYLFDAIRYVERTPVRRGVVRKMEEYCWSSIGLRASNEHSLKLSCFVCLDAGKVAENDGPRAVDALFKQHSVTGRPLGDGFFISRIEELTGRSLTKKKTGPKRV
jgi:putative transposase